MPTKQKTTQKLSTPKKILIVGGGGRENALAWAVLRSNGIEEVFVAPGNAGTEEHKGCKRLDISEDDQDGLLQASMDLDIDLILIGPEAPLASGLADFLRKKDLNVFGPGADGAQLEASKSWAKNLMEEGAVPTAKHWIATSEDQAIKILEKTNQPLVVKADGLAAGKGVRVCESIEETKEAIKQVFLGEFGFVGKKIVLEERLRGPEISVFALCDGQEFILLPCAQDHKRLKEGDLGPNTGGMGAYTPAPQLNKKGLEEVKELIINQTLKALRNRGIDYRGVIYAGLMLTEKGARVIEFNCRFGDPECQALMPLMGPEFPEILNACALGELTKAPILSLSKEVSVCIVAAAEGYPFSPRKGDVINIPEENDQYSQVFHAGTGKNKNGDFVTSGGRVLSVVAQAKNFELAFKKAYKRIKSIYFEGITYRLDIGHQVRETATFD